MTLTPAAVESALYVTSPVERAALVAHLELHGYSVDGNDLARAVAALGDKVNVVNVQIGGEVVQLWCLRGTRCG